MTQTSLLDRMHARMLESGRPWPAAELAESFLKLQGGPAPDALIRRLLSDDSRFSERAEGWTARALATPPLMEGRYLLVWIETAGQSSPEGWRLHLLPHAPVRGGGADEEILFPGALEGWERVRREWGDRRPAAFQAGSLGRLMQWMERTRGIPGWAQPPLDLLMWARAALVREGIHPAESLKAAQIPSLVRRWNLGPQREGVSGSPLASVAAILEHLLERFGSWTEDDLAHACQQALARRPLSWDGFAFRPQDLQAVPGVSGVYRFYNSENALLYVGKAVNLYKRVGSYFRPLPPEASKREQLLNHVHRFDTTPLPSELEALVCEARAIRCERPPWNVQVEVHPPERYPRDWWWPLVFVAPGSDPLRASVFVVSGPSEAFLLHLPRDERPEGLAALVSWFDAILERTEGTREGTGEEGGEGEGGFPPPAEDSEGPGGVVRLDPQETWLVVRSYLQQRDCHHRIDSIHFTSGLALMEALLRIAARPGGEESVDQRP